MYVVIRRPISTVPQKRRWRQLGSGEAVSLYILNNSAKNEPILILFGVQNPEGNFTSENCKLAYLTCVDNVATLPCEMQLI